MTKRDEDRSRRMIDRGLEQAEITYDLPDVSPEAIKKKMEEIEKMETEFEDNTKRRNE